MSPQPAVHPKVVENQQTNRSRQQNIRKCKSQILTDPTEVLEPDGERDERGGEERDCVEQEQVPISDPLRE
jgi:hypothetical protein